MALEHPIKTVFEWNEPIEIEGMPVNGHTLTARIVYLATSACDAITDIQCGDKTIDESSSPIIYDFSAAKICVDEHDTQGVEGNHVLQIVATNGQDTFTYLSSPLAFLEPG